MAASRKDADETWISIEQDTSDSMSDQMLCNVDNERRPLLMRGVSAMSVMGTVRLTDGDIVYVPAATADPRDPLNMKPWQKTVVVIVVCSFSAISLSLIGAFGGIIAFYIPKYLEDGESYASMTHLMTYPTISMGVGNLIGMPIAIAVGRRSVLLVATLVLLGGALLCTRANSLPAHLMARMIIGLAAGQSESVVPLIIQEIHFLHERTRVLMIQQTVQVVAGAIWVLCASPIANALSPSWWYGLGAILAGLQFLVSVFLLPETKYPREHENSTEPSAPAPRSGTTKPPLDFVNHKARTWKSDMRLWVGRPEWRKAAEVFKQALQLFLFPNVFWVICLSGLTLGVQISMSTTYAMILTKPPYNWQERIVSYINFGQIPIALILFPLLGYGSDKFIQWKARLNNGIHEPEGRLLILSIPVLLGIVCSFLYGQGATNPEHYHWSTYAITLNGYFFTFVATNIACITWLLDSYPTRAGPLLIIICTCRGFISCAVSTNVALFINGIGYDGTFTTFAAVTAALGLLLIPLYLYGKMLRIYTSHWTKDSEF